MGYFNPMLAYGLAKLAADAAAVGIWGFIVPDLPIEESASFEQALAPQGIALIRMVTPGYAAGPARAAVQGSAGLRVCRVDDRHHGPVRRQWRGRAAGDARISRSRAKARPVPVCVGFGIREQAQVAALAPHVDGVVIASATIEAMEGASPPSRC